MLDELQTQKAMEVAVLKKVNYVLTITCTGIITFKTEYPMYG